MTERFYLFLADLILVAHALIVLFNVGSLIVIWIGHFRGWSFVRNFYFRTIHLGLIGFVAVQVVARQVCPLTTWENQLRSKAGADPLYAEGFISHWLHGLLFFDLPQWVFTVGYLGFFALVLLTTFWVKPRPPR